jgi:hypothetical protein
MKIYADDADAKRRGMPNENQSSIQSRVQTPQLLLPSPDTVRGPCHWLSSKLRLPRRSCGILYRWWWDSRLRGQLLNLPYQEALLVDELFVLGAVLEESRQETQQLLTVANQNLLHRVGLVRIRNKDLESLDRIHVVLSGIRTLKTWNPS